MKRSLFSAVVISSALVLGASAAFAGPKDPLPALPGANASAAASSTTPSEDALRKGVVQIESGGKPMAVGTVLSRDGRVITSLSALGQTTEPEIRYADGTVVKAKIGHKDKTWDLALLVPQTGRWLDGLTPTDADPSTGELKSFLPKNGKLAQTGVGYKGRVDAKSKEGDSLKQAIEVDFKGASSVAGAPVIDPNGKVVGVIVKVCKGPRGRQGRQGASLQRPHGRRAGVCAPRVPREDAEGSRVAGAVARPRRRLDGAGQREGRPRDGHLGGQPRGESGPESGRLAGHDRRGRRARRWNPRSSSRARSRRRASGQAVKLLVYSQGKFRDVPVTLRTAP